MLSIQNHSELIKTLASSKGQQTNLLIRLHQVPSSINEDLQNLLSKYSEINELRLYLRGHQLNDEFLKNLQCSLEKIEQLNVILFQFEMSSFSQASSIYFIEYLRNRFYSDQDLNMSFDGGYIQLEIEDSLVEFKPQNTQFFMLDTQIKIVNIYVQPQQTEFLEIIQRGIDKQTQNLRVNIYHDELLIAQCCNCSSDYDLQVNIIFEDKGELMDYQIKNHNFVMIDLENEDFNEYDIERNQIMQEIQQRFNFILTIKGDKERKVLLSLSNQNLIKEKKGFLKQMLQQYDKKQIEKVFFYNKFQTLFYREIFQETFLSPDVIIPMLINLYVGNSEENKIHAEITNLQNKYHKNKDQFNFQFSSKYILLLFLQVFFDTHRNDRNQYLKFTVYSYNQDYLKDRQDKNLKEMSYMEKMAELNQNIFITELVIISDIYTHSNNFKNKHNYMCFPIIGRISNLRKISLDFYSQEMFVDFLIQNSKDLDNKNASTYLTISSNIKSHSIRQGICANKLLLSHCKYSRITYIYFSNKIFWNQLLKISQRFERLVRYQEEYVEDYSQYDTCENCVFCRYDTFINQKGKEICSNPESMIDQAYQSVDNHDSLYCSQTRKSECNCNNSQFQKNYKKLKHGDIIQILQMIYPLKL